jgi:NADH dehydrogenase
MHYRQPTSPKVALFLAPWETETLRFLRSRQDIMARSLKVLLMDTSDMNVVTGAFGFSGRSIARKLLALGKRVLTLTTRAGEDLEFAGRISVAPFNFDHPDRLAESLRGADVLYNTYWIRFARGEKTFERAIENSRILIKAAKDAGVRRIIHVSIANPSPDSPLPYYRGKALVEQAIIESGLSHAILRPAVLFGDQGILINNIAWFLRHLPVFAAPGDGEYRMQPIFIEDLAQLAVDMASKGEDVIVDAIGPERCTFNEWLQLIAEAVGRKPIVMHLRPELVILTTGLIGRVVGDVVLTRDEVRGLMANLLVSDQPPNAPTRLSDWLRENSSWLGTTYKSELRKHFRG